MNIYCDSSSFDCHVAVSLWLCMSQSHFHLFVILIVLRHFSISIMSPQIQMKLLPWWMAIAHNSLFLCNTWKTPKMSCNRLLVRFPLVVALFCWCRLVWWYLLDACFFRTILGPVVPVMVLQLRARIVHPRRNYQFQAAKIMIHLSTNTSAY